MKRSKFLSGFFWKFNEQITSQLVTFLVQIVLARILSPKDYGIIALVNVFIILADIFVSSGFNTSLIQKKDANETDFSTIFYCSLIFSWFVYLVLFLLAPLIANFYQNQQLTLVIRIFAMRLPISSFNAIQQAFVARKLEFQKIFVTTTAAAIFSGLVGIGVALLGGGVWALVTQYLTNTIASAIVLFFQIPWRPKLLFSKDSAKELLSYGWKVMVADFLGSFFNQLRSLIIGRFYNSASLAYYNRGMQFPNLISSNIDTTISSVLFPFLSENANNVRELRLLIRRSIRTSSYLIMPLMLGLAVVAKPMILLILTSKWLPAVPFMQWLCISSAFSTISNTSLQAMKASGRSDVLLRIELIKKPVYLILLVVGVKVSVYAVAITMTIYSAYAAVVNMGPNWKILGYSYKEQLLDLLPAIFMSVIMASITWSVQLLGLQMIPTFILQIIVGVSSYVLLSVVFKVDAFFYLLGYMKK